eukprot:GHRQ01012417.1.p1 GENE.GHRQ01012417.1~~GHRQ01012417.1.p1  ORF type:complete len:613 (+),score=232.73 GHRQ01012417.1:203-1840(+)
MPAAAAAGVLERMLKGSGAGAAGSASADSCGVLVRSGKHDKVTSMCFLSPPDSLSAAACVWWAVGDRLEFYSDATQSTTSFAAAASEHAAITVLTLDSAGNVWGGTAKGTVFMRRRTNWQQVFVERAFNSCVRTLSADADSGVVWGGDDAGRLAVFRWRQGSLHTRLECTATILPGKAGALKGRSSAALDLRPRSLTLRRNLSYRAPGQPAEGPISALLLRDEHAWVAGGHTEPWLAVFDAVAGTQLDTWPCGSYGCCQAMAYMLTTAAVAQQASCSTALFNSGAICGDSSSYNLPRYVSRSSYASAKAAAAIASVPEDGIGEQPRCSWRLITGHDNGQLLLWSGASDRLVPLVKVGEPLAPVRAVTVLEQQGLLVVARANGDVSLFLRPARDEDWVLPPVQLQQHRLRGAGPRDGPADGARTASGGGIEAGGSGDGSSSAAAAGDAQPQQQQAHQLSQLLQHQQGLTAIRPRKVSLRSHRSPLVCAAACAAGVATASSSGAIQLWTAEGIAREAERGGLLLRPPPGQQASAQPSGSMASLDYSR